MGNNEKLGSGGGQDSSFDTLRDMPEFTAPKQDSIDALVGFGYTEEDAVKITSAHGVSSLKDSTLSENISRNFAFLQELGYSQEGNSQLIDR